MEIGGVDADQSTSSAVGEPDQAKGHEKKRAARGSSANAAVATLIRTSRVECEVRMSNQASTSNIVAVTTDAMMAIWRRFHTDQAVTASPANKKMSKPTQAADQWPAT